MRLIKYYVVEKTTNKAAFVDCRLAKVNEFYNSLENKNNYKICYKWQSI